MADAATWRFWQSRISSAHLDVFYLRLDYAHKWSILLFVISCCYILHVRLNCFHRRIWRPCCQMFLNGRPLGRAATTQSQHDRLIMTDLAICELPYKTRTKLQEAQLFQYLTYKHTKNVSKYRSSMPARPGNSKRAHSDFLTITVSLKALFSDKGRREMILS